MKLLKYHINHFMIKELNNKKDKYYSYQASLMDCIFLSNFNKIDDLLDYFELFNDNLSKKTLNSYLKSVSNP